MLLVVDTGVLVSSADSSEPRHDVSANLLREHAGALAVPGPVVPETAWFIESRLGPAAESQFLQLITRGELDVIDLTIADYQRCITLIDTYADMGLGLVEPRSSSLRRTLALLPSPPTTNETSGSSNRSMLTRSPFSPEPSASVDDVSSSFEVSDAAASIA